MEIIGTSKTISSATFKAQALALSNEPCLITGEAGTGKTLVSNLIHTTGKREAENIVVFDAMKCENIEKGLFGESKTNLLGIENITTGAIDSAGSGTIVIKNLQMIPLEVQLQLAATIQLGGYRPVGAEESLSSLCRYIFHVRRPPERLIEERRLVPELFQVLKKNMIVLTPLKERQEDIEPLAEHFIRKWCIALGCQNKKASKAAMRLLKKYSWPRNAAELQLTLLNTLIHFSADEIQPEHIQLKLDDNWQLHTDEQLDEIALEEIIERKLKQFMHRLGRYDVENLYKAIIERVERPLIRLVMERSKNNQLRAAKILGINRNTLRTKLQKLEIE